MRKLASVQRILEVQDIEGKDRIGLATVLGWHVIVNKAEVKAGDLAVYFEIDSVLDKTNPVFAFMEKRNYRVKTLKMAGVVSQGLVMPLSAFPMLSNVKEGDDVTEALKVVKFEVNDEIEVVVRANKKDRLIKKLVSFVPSPIRRVLNKTVNFIKYSVLGIPQFAPFTGFPTEVDKTDETRLQAVPEMLDRIAEVYKNDCDGLYITEKVDGSSGTFLLRRKPYRCLLGFLARYGLWQKERYDYIVCSRNRVAVPGSSYDILSKKHNIKQCLMECLQEAHGAINYIDGLIRYNFDYICIQGEVLGPKVQGNKYGLKELELRAFNLIAGSYVSPHGYIVKMSANNTKKIFSKYGIKTVPVLADNAYFRNIKTVDDWVEYATGKSVLYDGPREGIVVRNYVGDHFSFKVINPEFLLKYKL